MGPAILPFLPAIGSALGGIVQGFGDRKIAKETGKFASELGKEGDIEAARLSKEREGLYTPGQTARRAFQ